MNEQVVRKMYYEGMDRANDADILAQSLQQTGNSSSILRVLAMEVLLKAAITLSGQKPKRNHDYANHWLALPGYARKAILEQATDRMPGHTDFTDLPKLLRWYRHVFEKARYGYETLESYSDEERIELEAFWDRIGAEPGEVQYYPLELICLVEGLAAYIESKLPFEATAAREDEP